MKRTALPLNFHHLKPRPYVLVNGLSVALQNIQAVLSRYTVCVVAVNDDPTYPVTLCGSGTLLCYSGRLYMVCCYHQVKDVDLSRIGIFASDEAVVITASGVLQFAQDNVSEANDIIAFDFTESVKGTPSLQSLFFNFRAIPPNAPSTHTAFLQVAGFSFEHQEYHLGEEESRLGLVKVKVIYQLERPSNDRAVLVLRTAEGPLNFNPNGLSGGSAFSVQFVNDKAMAFFAGMICRAGASEAYMIKSNYIEAALRSSR
ncbi:hypothetical protein ASD46_09045 [Rhizobium sp. Root491]|uniref:Uncharacterized protein n=1 Tax=Agrobacterium arsenijevicii TaxID=1585697 RepID=A0ABR5D7W5_9HYPH|nr:hypothetical protein [Rhizobium sp. Root491]KJF73157.1 hypothetical protein RP75_13195 [Agrobacterium arsenijevicii]KQY45264.1 hypothetical protein ASD46_09045 [Rhizobium sp. Root491]